MKSGSSFSNHPDSVLRWSTLLVACGGLAGVGILTVLYHQHLDEILRVYRASNGDVASLAEAREVYWLSFWQLLLLISMTAVAGMIFLARSSRPILKKLQEHTHNVEQSAKRISRINETLLAFGPDAQENINRLTALTGELLSGTCALFNCMENGRLCALGQWNTPADFQSVDAPDGHICHDVILHSSNQPYLVRQLPQTNYLQSDPNVKPYRLETYLGQAIFVSGQAVGSLCVVYQTDFEPTSEDYEILGFLAAAVASEETRRRQECALRESEERYQLAIQGTNAGIWDWHIQTGQVVFNARWAEMLGYSLAELEPTTIQTWIDLCHPEDYVRSQALLEKHFRKELPTYECEARVRHKCGDWVWILDRGQVTEWSADGRPLRVTGTHLDITDRKRAEHELVQSLSLLEASMESTADGILVVDLSGRVTAYNNRFLKLWNIPDDLAGHRDDDRLLAHVVDQLSEPESFLAKVRELYTQPLEESYDLVSFKDGRCFERYSKPQWIEQKVAGRVWSFRDITIRTQAINALRQSESRYRALYETMAQGVIHQDSRGKVLAANPAAARILGIDLNSLLDGDHDGGFLEWFHEDGQPFPVAEQPAALALASGQPAGPAVMGLRPGTSKKLCWIVASSVPQYSPLDNSICGVVTSFSDITDRKHAEEALRSSEEKFRGIAEQLNEVIYLTDIHGVMTYFSPAAATLFGAAPEELTGKHFSEYLAAEDIERVYSAMHRCMDTREPISGLRLTMKRADGTLFDGEMDSTLIIQDREISGTLGVIRNVSERIAAENALRNSERLLSESQRAAGIGSYDLDLVRGVWSSSDAMNEVLGVTPDDPRTLEGWLQLIHPDWRDTMQEYFLKVLATGGKFDKEYPISRRNDGTQRWVHGLGKLEFDTAQRPIRMVGTIQDVTDRKIAEEALANREAEYRHLLENSGEGIGVADGHEVFTYANPAAEELFGVASGELKGKSLLDFLTDEDKELVMAESRQRSTGARNTYELKITRPDGDTRDILLTARPKFSPTGVYEGSFGIFRDMTELKRAEQERQKLEAQLRQAQKLETIGTLAGGVAHDFNNILTPILGYADMTLLQMPGDSPTRAHIENISKAALRAKDLVKQILTFSRQTEQERRPMLVQLIVKEAIKLLRASIPATIEVIDCVDNNAPPVDCDPTQIHQVIMNLCTNAFHAMREGEGELTVELQRCNMEECGGELPMNLSPGAYIRIGVSDTGHGMDRATMDRIFEPFFTTKSNREGTGLGLSVVHGIVKAHGGAIKVTSEIGSGTTFHIYLPCSVVAVTESAGPGDTTLIGAGHLLLVDDEPDIVGMTREMLESMGYHVTARTSGLEALEAFRSDPARFDLVITDQTMPHMTGTQFVREILIIRPDTPVILMTGFSEAVTQKNFRNYGFSDLVMKPLLARDLNSAIQRCLTNAAL